MFRSLVIRFDDREKFAQEYQRNLANGGIFVPTEEPFEAREVVEVELDLTFCERSVTLQAEIVSKVSSGIESAGGQPGVAVQFLVPAEELRDLLGGIAGVPPPPPPPEHWPGREGPARKNDRLRASVAVSVEVSGEVLQGRTRNLSRSGVLLTLDAEPPVVGSEVELSFQHPTSGETVEVAGRVTRHAESEGRVVGIAVQFTLPRQSGREKQLQLDDLRTAAHTHLLGGIRGPVATLGLPNLLQMFASAAESGSMTITCGDEEGRVVFESGSLRHAALGPARGMKALSRLMTWEEGEFYFLPTVDPSEPAGENQPIYGVVLDAVTQLDELRRLDLTLLQATAKVRRTDLEVDAALEKLDQAVLDLAAAGASVAAILDGLPDADNDIYRTLLSLLELGLIEVDAGA